MLLNSACVEGKNTAFYYTELYQQINTSFQISKDFLQASCKKCKTYEKNNCYKLNLITSNLYSYFSMSI